MVKRKSPDKHDGDTTVTYGGGASGGDARDERDRNGFSDAMDTTTEQLAAGTSAFSSFFKLQPRLKHLQRTSAVCEKLRQISSSILTEKLNSVSTTTVSGTRSNNDGSASPAAPSQDSTSFENESGSTPGIQSSSTLTSLFNAASLLFLELEQLNRATYVMNRSAKHETQDAKQKMSLQHLALQNLNYERLHLQREIAKCNEMETIYQDIDLVSLDDFNKGAPEELSKVDNEHKLMLNRLQFELDERKRLQKEEKELLAVKEKLAKENKDASADIEKLDTQLENVVKSTQPLQEKLNIQITERHRLVDLGKRLPGPLFVLFQQAYGFAEITGGITVDIIGDATAATTLLEQDRQSAEEGATATASTENDDDDGDNGADEDNDGKPMKKRKVRREVDKKAAQVAFHEKHPLEVVVKIKQNARNVLALLATTDSQSAKDLASLTFSYLAKFNIVTVSIVLHQLQTNQQIPSVALLHNLFPRDDGLRSPNPSNMFLGDGARFSPVIANGYAFRWAQHLCGLVFPEPHHAVGVPQSSRRKPDDEKPDTSSSSSLSSSSIGWFSEACADGTLVVRPHIGKIVDLVRRRWKALGVLGRILGELATGKQTLPTPIQGTSTKKTKLLDWKEKRQDDSASSSNDLRYTFTVNADGRQFEVLVTIPLAYPNEIPHFEIARKSSKEEARQSPQRSSQQGASSGSSREAGSPMKRTDVGTSTGDGEDDMKVDDVGSVEGGTVVPTEKDHIKELERIINDVHSTKRILPALFPSPSSGLSSSSTSEAVPRDQHASHLLLYQLVKLMSSLEVMVATLKKDKALKDEAQLMIPDVFLFNADISQVRALYAKVV